MRDLSDIGASSRLVLIVCSQLFREALVRLLDGPGITFTEGMKTVDDAVAYMQSGIVPALAIVVLTDEHATQTLDVIRQTRRRFPSVRWLLLTDSTSPIRFRQAIAAGIHGLLKQEISASVLKHAAELLLLGQSLLPVGLGDLDLPHPPAEATNQILQPACLPPACLPMEAEPDPLPDGTGSAVAPNANTPPVQLSARERQILECLAQGDPNKLIARKLAITDATVKVHVKALLRKLRVVNRTQLAVLAFRNRGPLEVTGDLPMMDLTGDDLPIIVTRHAPNGPVPRQDPSQAVKLAHASGGSLSRQDRCHD